MPPASHNAYSPATPGCRRVHQRHVRPAVTVPAHSPAVSVRARVGNGCVRAQRHRRRRAAHSENAVCGPGTATAASRACRPLGHPAHAARSNSGGSRRRMRRCSLHGDVAACRPHGMPCNTPVVVVDRITCAFPLQPSLRLMGQGPLTTDARGAGDACSTTGKQPPRPYINSFFLRCSGPRQLRAPPCAQRLRWAAVRRRGAARPAL